MVFLRTKYRQDGHHLDPKNVLEYERCDEVTVNSISQTSQGSVTHATKQIHSVKFANLMSPSSFIFIASKPPCFATFDGRSHARSNPSLLAPRRQAALYVIAIETGEATHLRETIRHTHTHTLQLYQFFRMCELGQKIFRLAPVYSRCTF